MPNYLIRLELTQYEEDLLDDIRDIGYGELIDVHTGPAGPGKAVEVSSHEASFLRSIRRVKFFNRVIIQDGLPMYGERRTTTPRERQCIQKTKFA